MAQNGIEKGPERDFENDEFEKANVIFLGKYHFDTQSFQWLC